MIRKEVTGAKAYCNPGDAIVKCNAAANAIKVYLAPVVTFENAPIIKKTDSSANAVTVIAAKDEYLEGGTYQVETATAAGTISGSGNATVVVTSADMEGSPITISVPVTNGETAATWAARVRLYLGANKNITDTFTVSGSGTSIVLTQRQYLGNDSTLNISLDNGTCTGITTAATSTDTTAGVAVTVPEQYDYRQFIPTDGGWALGDTNLVDAVLDNITVTTINKLTITAPSSSAVLTIANGKTFKVDNTITLAADADSKTLTLGSHNINIDTTADSTVTLPTTGTLSTLAGTETLTNKTLTTPIIASIYQDSGKTKLMSLPDTASDTLAAIAATQTFTNKTLTTPIIASIYQDAGKTKLMTLPDTASDTLAAIAATQTFTNKTLTTPVIASFYQDAGKTKLMTVPDTASDTLAAIAATQTLTNKTLGTTNTIDQATLVIYNGTPVNAVASSLSTNLTGADNDMVYTAKTKGVIGDTISVKYTDPGTASASIGVTVTGTDIDVSLATDAGVCAYVAIGGGGDGTVTITKDAIGTIYNSDTVEVVLGSTPSGALSAAIASGDVTVTLGMDAGTASSGTLTVSDNATNDVLDGETVTIGGTEVYEFDWNNTYTGGRNQVDISGKASIAKAKGSLHLFDIPHHNDSFVVNTTTMTVKHDGSSGAHLIDFSACATAEFGSGDFGVVAIPADGETITINARVYEFDTNSAIGGDIAINIAAATTVDDVLTAIESAINGDGAAVVTASKNLSENFVTFTAKVIGAVGNYAVAEACTSGAWMPGRGSGGNLVDGADPTVLECVKQIVADFDDTTCTASDNNVDLVYFQYNQYGTAGNAIVFTENMTHTTADGANVLGGTTAGADCSKEDAVAALKAKITAVTAKGVTATDNLDGTMTLTANTVGTGGDAIGTTETMSHGAWGHDHLQGGVNIAPDNAKNTASLVAAAVTALSGVSAVASGSGADPLTGIEGPTQFANGADPAITSTAANVKTAIEGYSAANALVSLANKGGDNGTGVVTAMNKTQLASGVNGTVAAKGTAYMDASYFYLASAANTIADANWKRAAITTY